MRLCGHAQGDRAQPVDAYFEAHIEQGPVLESHGNPIGVVTGGQAIRWLDVDVTGVAAHAGTTPMPYRKDALFASAAMALQLEAIAATFRAAGSRHDRSGRDCRTSSRNTIAGRVGVHGRPASSRRRANRRDGARAARARSSRSRERVGSNVAIDTYWTSPATPFDAECVGSSQEAATQARLPARAHRQRRGTRRDPPCAPCADGDGVHPVRRRPVAQRSRGCAAGRRHVRRERVDQCGAGAGGRARRPPTLEALKEPDDMLTFFHP